MDSIPLICTTFIDSVLNGPVIRESPNIDVFTCTIKQCRSLDVDVTMLEKYLVSGLYSGANKIFILDFKLLRA
jgi:hypothetical protein